MCGIVGIIDSHFAVEAESVRLAADALLNRGPDDCGVWTSENAGLGHRRLSVIDLSPSGRQPMVSQNGRFVIVFNGEIYNFRDLRTQLDEGNRQWQGQSDTEVILAAYAKWGIGCIERFHGMFSFAIWDRWEKRLFAARDRMGEKPFFYHFSERGFAFASRPRALFSLLPDLSSEFDSQALRNYIESGNVPAPYSIFRMIRKLPPAHWLCFQNGVLHIERYWDFRQIATESAWENRKENDLLDELDEIAGRCVRQRMISDVPLGAFLSGGVDSSLVAALMAKASTQPIKTFTIGFEESRFDESPHAATVARSLGADHYCERMRVKDLLDLLPLYFREYDEPFADSSALPTLAVSRATRRHVTVSLSGDGGDELFGGYHYYQIVNRLEILFRFPAKIRQNLASLARTVPRHNFQLLAAVLEKKTLSEAFCFARSFTKDFDDVLRPELLCETAPFNEFLLQGMTEFPSNLAAAEQAMRLDASCTLPDDYLQKVDVATMAFSLESRQPLLDQDLVEWAMRLPLKWKIRGKENKYLLRRLAYRYVPRHILNRPKQGFEVPLAEWLRGPLYEWAAEQLADASAYRALPLDRVKVLKLLEIHRSSARNAHPLLWAILALCQFSARCSTFAGSSRASLVGVQ